MNTLRKLSRGFAFKIIANVVTAGIGITISVILNRYYGKESYGLLVLVYTVTGLAFSLSGLGVTNTINRFVPKYAEKCNWKNSFSLVLSGFILKLICISIFGILLLILAKSIAVKFFHQGELHPLLLIGVLYFASFTFVDFTFQVFQGLQLWKKESVLNVAHPALYFFLIVSFIYMFKVSLKTVIFLNAIAAILTVFLGILLIPKDIKNMTLSIIGRIKPSDINNQLNKIRLFGFPFILIDLNFYLIQWFDKVILGRYISPGKLAFYYIAFTSMNYLMIMIKNFTVVLMPHMAGESSNNHENIKKKFNIISKFYVHVASLVAIILFFLIKPAVVILYGVEYSPVIHIFRLFLIVFLIRAFCSSSGIFLINVLGKSKINSVLITILSIQIILYDLILIPRFGINGAIISAIMAYFIYVILLGLSLKNIWNTSLVKSICKALGGLSLLIIIYYWILPFFGFENPYISAIIFLSIYILGMKLSNELTHKDFLFLKRLIVSIKSPTAAI